MEGASREREKERERNCGRADLETRINTGKAMVTQ